MPTTIFFYNLKKMYLPLAMEHVYNDHPNTTNDLPLLTHPVIFHLL